MEKDKLLEGKIEEQVEEKADLGDTSAPEEQAQPAMDADAPVDNISNFPSPTEEQMEDADLTPSENAVENESEEAIEPDVEAPVVPSEEPAEPEQSGDDVFDEFLGDATPSEPVQAEPEMHEENGVMEAPIKMFTQSQVDDIAGKTRLETREKTFRYIYDRYGVNSEEELDDLIGNAQRYDSLKEAYDADKLEFKHSREAADNELRDIKEKVALLESGIDKDRYDDAKFILKGKGLDVTIENIQNELATHPEWRKIEKAEEKPADQNFVKTSEGSVGQMPSEPVSKLSVLGNEPLSTSEEVLDDEEKRAMRMFKL